MRRKRIALEQAVLAAAQQYIAECATDSHGNFAANADECAEPLFDAVKALNAYAPAEIVNGPGRWVEGSPETSQAAALRLPAMGSVRKRIIDEVVAVLHHGAAGLTDEELCRRLKAKHQTLSSARNFLVQAGWLTDSGKVRETSSGNEAVIWTLTPAAREALALRP